MDYLSLIHKYYADNPELENILLCHSRMVKDKALDIVKRHPELHADATFVEEAAMLHDIGIVKTDAAGIQCFGTEPYIRHGVEGAAMLRAEGYPRHAGVCERHTGAGLSAREIEEQNLPLPAEDFIPQSIEEEIICFADKFFSKTRPTEEKTFERARMSIARFGVESLKRFDDWALRFLSVCLIVFTLSACSVDKYLGDEELYLQKVEVVSTQPEATKKLTLDGYVRQQPNSKWFGFKVPMHIYCSANPDNTKGWSKFLRKIGEAPRVFSTEATELTMADMKQVLNNAGFLHAQIDTTALVNGHKLALTYNVSPGERYNIASLKREVEDPAIEAIICGPDTSETVLAKDIPFDAAKLNEERNRISTLLRNIGYYKFNKDHITFIADTLEGSTDVDLTMKVGLHRENRLSEAEQHPQMRIGKVGYFIDILPEQVDAGEQCDSTLHRGTTIYTREHQVLRRNVLTSNTLFHTGELYSEERQRSTYNNFMRLNALSYSNIRLRQHGDSDTLDCAILLNHSRPHSISFDIEGTNSAGDLGAAASATYQHKNIFHGSEVFTMKLRGAYEAITGLEGYDGHNYHEMGGETKLAFPTILFPFVSKEFSVTHRGASEIALQYNRQDRPEFDRRVLTAAWRYRWQNLNQRMAHRFDLLEINYVYMPWMSSTFREQYLDSLGQQNAILRYNYENLLITKLGYSFTYNTQGTSVVSTFGKNAYVIKGNIETSGNILGVLTSMFNSKYDDNNHRTFCGIAYAQYVKGDLDLARSLRINRNNSLALHCAFGIAIPYGNSDILPFEKRYFAGGANSVRGWSVRSLGPGAYKGADHHINFLNQSGDIKLEGNIEYRTQLFWKFSGALFVDAGNIWTIRRYADQPDGEFRFDKFYRQIAVAYGLGLRLQLDFFTLRFDGGMKAVNPAYEHGKRHLPLLHPDFDRDFAFHFAIGLPF